MKFVKLSWNKLLRSKVQSILLLILFFAIGNCIFCTLGMSQTTKKTEEEIRKTMNPLVKLSVDESAVEEYLTEQFALGNITYVRYSDIVDDAMIEDMCNDDRVLVKESITDYICGWTDEIEPYNPRKLDGNPFIFECNVWDDQISFHDGTYELVEGRFYNQKEIDHHESVCLITKKIADENRVKVGDIINFTTAHPINYEDVGMEIEYLSLKVIGIYKNNEIVKNTRINNISDYPENKILAPSTTIIDYDIDFSNEFTRKSIILDGEDLSDFIEQEKYYYGGSVSVLLEDPTTLTDYIADYSKYDGEFTNLIYNNSTYETLAKPLDSMKKISNVMLIVVIMVSILVISLITALTFIIREKEVGIMIALGINKLIIIGQLLLEMIIVAVLGFTLSIFSGKSLANKVSHMILSSHENEEVEVIDNDFIESMSMNEMIDQYEVVITVAEVVYTYLIGMIVIVVSIIIPFVMLLRLSPKKIMMDAN